MYRIAVIGAGPAGLTLASILQNHNIHVTVFEKDLGVSDSGPSTSLDLHVETGQRAIKEAGLRENFQKYARYDGQDFLLVDKHKKTHLELRGIETGRPEIDRNKLRQILLGAIRPDTIRYGKKLIKVNKNTLYFEDSTESEFDLIVGADGAWSKVRSILTHIPPFYSGISGLQLWISNIDTRYPELSVLAGRGSFFCHGDADEQSLFIQRNGDGSVRILAVGRRPLDWVDQVGFNFNDPDGIRKLLRKQYQGWHPDLLEFINASDDTVKPLVIHTLPAGLLWPHKTGTTLIGDAAHLMTPFSGQGVNVAMEDAVELATALVANPGDLDTAVTRYEEQMFARAKVFTGIGWSSLMDRWGAGSVERLAIRFDKILNKYGSVKREESER